MFKKSKNVGWSGFKRTKPDQVIKRGPSLPVALWINFLLGRKVAHPNRYPTESSPRTQPPPDLPPGPHSTLANNRYFSRSGRHTVKLPEVVFNAMAPMTVISSQPLISDKKDDVESTGNNARDDEIAPKRPSNSTFKWDHHTDNANYNKELKKNTNIASNTNIDEADDEDDDEDDKNDEEGENEQRQDAQLDADCDEKKRKDDDGK